MLILILLNILLFTFYNKSIKSFSSLYNEKLKKIFIIGVVFELILLLFYRLDLLSLNRNVYYSDAETYWKNTLELINYGQSDGYNALYYKICYYLQISSPFIWVGWNNLFNITCINFSIVFVVYSLTNFEFNKENDAELYRKIKLLLILTMFNPFIIYSLMRNLKDALFMVYVLFIAFILNKAINKNNIVFSLITYLFFSISMYTMIQLRPWGFIIPLIAIAYLTIYLIINLIKKVKKEFQINRLKIILILIFVLVALIFVSFVLCFKIFPHVIATLRVWIPSVMDSLMQRNLISMLLGFFKFIVAPGPLRALFGNKYFVHYTGSGNIMCCIGQIMWWLSIVIILSNFIISIKNKKTNFKIKNHFCNFISIITFIYIVIYVIQYGGTAEIRLRAVMYIFSFSIFFSIFSINDYKCNKKIYNVVSILSILCFTLITFLGM